MTQEGLSATVQGKWAHEDRNPTATQRATI
jgi:hypothetical protein